MFSRREAWNVASGRSVCQSAAGEASPRVKIPASHGYSETPGCSGAERAEQLLDRYGTGASSIIPALGDAPDERLLHEPSYSHNEIRYLINN